MPRPPALPLRRALSIAGFALAASLVTPGPSARPPSPGSSADGVPFRHPPWPALFDAGSAAAADGCADLLAAANRALEAAEKQRDPSKAREALGLLDRAGRLCPDDPEIPFAAGLASTILADPDAVKASIATIERLVTARALELNRPASEGPGDPRALFLRALVHRTFGGRPDAAIDLLNRIRARAPGFRPAAVAAMLFWSHIDYAGQLSENEEAERAIKEAALAESVARAADDKDKTDLARHRRAQVMNAGRRWSEAQEILEDLAKRYPKDAHVHFDLSTAYAEQIRLDDAVTSWRETLRLLALPDANPRLVELLSDAQMRLGVCLCQRGDTTEGTQVLLKYAETHANDPRVYLYLGKAATLVDDFEQAVKYLERGRALDPSCESILRELYKLYSTTSPDAAKAKELEERIEKDAPAREAEMKRRRHLRPDKSDGCT